MLQYVPTAKLLDPRRPLRCVNRNSTEYLELAESVRKDGILQPLLVRPVGDGAYEVVEGAHRLQAGRDAHLEELPCLVKELTDYEVSIIQLKAQAIRPKMQVVDFARRLKELIDGGYTTLGELALAVGKSVMWVKGILSLDRLCPAARTAANRGEISLAAAKDLAKLPRGLQEVLLLDASGMDTNTFHDLAVSTLKHYRELIRTGRVENYLIRMAKPQPHLRSMTEIRNEVDTWENAGLQIELQKATSALDGWRACIIWLMNLDPISLKMHEEKRISAKAEKANALERRKLDRSLRKKLLGDSEDE